jgi:pyrroloquinoline quinone biosynthesis protein B
MRVRLLGTAAGGGFPQWNCGCPNCRTVRAGEARASARTQTSVALSADGRRWFLIGASPDIRTQIESFPLLHPQGKVRGSAIEGILLTCADLDHVLGLFVLREGGTLHIHATPAVQISLCQGLGLEAVLHKYCRLKWHEPPDQPEPLRLGNRQPSGLLFQAFPVPGNPPKYMEGMATTGPGDCIGYLIKDERTRGRLAVLPGSMAFDAALGRRLKDCDVVLFDGTFWSEEELIRLGAGNTAASAMGHLPVGGFEGSLVPLARLPARRKIYLHINNTNPILLDDSPERRQVDACGVEVGRDGLELEV